MAQTIKFSHKKSASMRHFIRFPNLPSTSSQTPTREMVSFGLPKEIDADMIAMTTHGSRDLGHLYTFSVAADVVNHAHLLTWTCAQQSVSQLL
ncbi:universal stress protein [Paucibacter sp. O1-1]|nr:universal stress protein [Paucibacter sp. O1-1]MDA3830747.1 universal stress protein [Paucibacter sp. O1-1]